MNGIVYLFLPFTQLSFQRVQKDLNFVPTNLEIYITFKPAFANYV